MILYVLLSFAVPIRGISYLILPQMCSKWSEVVPIKSTTTDTIVNSLSQVY